MRILPCRVDPIPGETPAGFLNRLAESNALEVDSFTHHIWRELGVRRMVTADRRFIATVESLGGVRTGFFDRERAKFRLYRRCHHSGWRLQRCAKCDVVDRARTACLVCSDGNRTEVFNRGGRFCVRHRRWHYGTEDEFVADSDGHLRAEQALSGLLWSRGVTMHTGEFDLATRLILDSWREQPGTDQHAARRTYGPVIELLVTLTYPDVALTMAALAESHRRQVEGLIGLVVGAGKGSRTPELEDTASRVIRAHRAAMYQALRMPNSKGATITTAPFEKGIAEASYRAKAVFLRHVTRSGRRDELEERVVRGAPASRVVSRRLVPGWADDAPWNSTAGGGVSTATQIGRVAGDQVHQSDAEHLGESQERAQRGVSRVSGS